MATAIPALAILTSLILCGCGMAEQYAAQQDLDQSQAAYERCTAIDGGDSAQCQAAEGKVESNQRTLDQTSSSVSPVAPLGRRPLQFRTTIDLDSPDSDNSDPGNSNKDQ